MKPRARVFRERPWSELQAPAPQEGRCLLQSSCIGPFRTDNKLAISNDSYRKNPFSTRACCR